MKQVDVDTIRYNKNFLSRVIFRLDIEPILKLRDNLDSDFQEQIRDLLPGYSTVVANEFQTDVKNGIITDQRSNTINQYVFENSNKDIKLTISFNFFLLEVSEYTNFVDYSNILHKLLKKFYGYYTPVVIKRLGYRYINQISIPSGDPFDWSGYINDGLTTSFESELFKDLIISRTMSQIQYQFDDYAVVFSYGIYNSEYPARISKKEFILDYDCFSHDVEYSQIDEKMIEYNKCIVRLFENSIEDELRNILRRNDE